MRSRRGFTLIELLVVMAILAVLAAMVMGGIQKARLTADRINCTNNLRQLGAAMHSYESGAGILPRARSCPDLQNGNDPDCKTLTDVSYTGPNEEWWAPYDNRPGTSATQPLGDDNFNHGPLWPLVEQGTKTFQCPQGVDLAPDSSTFGKRYQVSYGMNFVTNGPSGQPLVTISNNAGTGNVMLAWDHNNTPACCVLGWPRQPCKPYVDVKSPHYPRRHGGRLNVLFCDGHVSTTSQNEIEDRLFVAS